MIYVGWDDILGIVGVTLVLSTYALLQMGYLSARQLSYSLINAIGSLMILYSLFYHWNLSSVVIEISWLLISALGIGRSLWQKKRDPSPSAESNS